MTKVTKEDITKMARLAKIETSDAEKEKLVSQVGNIIGWVDQLAEVDTKNVEILTNVHDMSLTLHKDEVLDGDIAEDVLQNSKDAKYGYFAVPKVIE